MRSLIVFVFVFLGILAVYDAVPYNKYGRTCKDILCTVREECVMQRDECTGFSDKCGTYPTCKRKPGVGKTGCAAMKCPTGHFCSIRQENCDKPPCQIKPTCIAFRTPSPKTNIPDGDDVSVPPVEEVPKTKFICPFDLLFPDPKNVSTQITTESMEPEACPSSKPSEEDFTPADPLPEY